MLRSEPQTNDYFFLRVLDRHDRRGTTQLESIADYAERNLDSLLPISDSSKLGKLPSVLPLASGTYFNAKERPKMSL